MTRLLVTRDAAEYCNVGSSYLTNQAKLGHVAYVLPSPKKMMFEKADLDSWMSSWRKVEAKPSDTATE
jgi:hypothetical protein